MFEIEYTDEFETWWNELSVIQQEDISHSIKVLEKFGPTLGRPYVDTIKGSQFKNMKELRTQSKGDPLRTFFAFDPKRNAILLIGGDKTGDDNFYKKMIPIADKLYIEHLREINHG